MPDDDKIAITEQINQDLGTPEDSTELDAFNLEAEGGEDPPLSETQKEEGGSEKKEAEVTTEPKVEKDASEEKEPGEEELKKQEPPTAEERIAQRAKEIEIEEPPGGVGTSETKEKPLGGSALETKEKPPDLSVLTKEAIAGYLASVSDDILPDGTLTIGNDEINLQEFSQDFPDQWAAVKVLSAVIAEKEIAKQIKGSNLLTRGEAQEKFALQEQAMTNLLWWQDVGEQHSDAKSISKSTEFQEWLGGQPETIKRMAGAGAPPDDAILVLDYYKEGQAKAKTEVHDKEVKDKKQKKDDLHSETMREKPGALSSGEQAVLDEEAAFEAEAKRQ